MGHRHENVDPFIAEEIRELELEGVEVTGNTIIVSDDAGQERKEAIAIVLRENPDSRIHLD